VTRLAAQRPHWLLCGSIVVGALQTWLARRLTGQLYDDFWVMTGIAWVVALILASERGDALQAKGPGRWTALGAGLTLGTLCVFAGTSTYHTFHRVLPFVGGVGCGLVAVGPAGLRRFRAPQLVFLIPALTPLPSALRYPLAATSWTAWCASLLGRTFGEPLAADGSFIRTPVGALHVIGDCGGLLGESRMWALAAIAIALFRTTTLQKVALAASGFAVAFWLNALRIEVLAAKYVRGDDAGYEYWHFGPGASVFALMATLTTAPVWWLILRSSAPSGGKAAGTTAPASRG
jgi:exosortase/archaeosortase family protein